MSHDETTPRAEPLASTILDLPSTFVPRPADDAPANVHATDSASTERYEARGILGTGGMGIVRLVHDRRIGREVALKVLRDQSGPSDRRVARFVREARIQGQLEHPGLVPVHDLSTDEEGAVYFTMTRVRGATLTAVLERLSAGDPEYTQRFTTRRLLTALSSVCLAIDFAHEHGIVHRDLKPDNIMLGDHGQVQLLDWGVARVLYEEEDGETSAITGDAPGPPPVHTVLGSIIGTPGYMSPEQAAGQVELVGPRSDVYSLGAILFEILAGAPLHEGETAIQRLDSTLRGADARASVRAPEAVVPPELEAACVHATAQQPEARVSSARQLSDLIERYLEGDRDVQRRRELAAEHAARAHTLAMEAEAPGEAGNGARAEAHREVARALAFDPENRRAMETLVQLFLSPPKEDPAEVAQQLDAAVQAERRSGVGIALLSSTIWLLLVPLGLAMGVHHWWFAGTTIGLIVLSIAACAHVRRRARITALQAILLLAVNLAAIASFSSVLGPFILVPSVALGQVVFFSLTGGVPGRRVILAAMATATVLLPWVLELAGVLPPSMRFTNEGILIAPRAVDFPPGLTTVYLVATTLALVPVSIYIADRMRALLSAAERRNVLQVWQLRQMVPHEAQQRL